MRNCEAKAVLHAAAEIIKVKILHQHHCISVVYAPEIVRIRKAERPRHNAVGDSFPEDLVIENTVAACMRVGGAVDPHADARALVIKKNAGKLIDIVIVNLLTDVIGAVLVGIDIFADV